MADWHKRVARLASRLESAVDDRVERLGITPPRPPRIEAYRGFGRADRVWVKARALRGMPLAPARERDSVWVNLSATLQRFESDEIPGAKVRVRCPGVDQELVADREGYVEAWLEPAPPLADAAPWHELEMELLEPATPGAEPFRTRARVLVPPATAQLGVISDLDDTVVRTDVASRLRMMKNVFLGNAHTRMPFPGVAAFYRALERGTGPFAHNPFFYVSSSPWNLFEVLAEFLELRQIPAGPLLLRDWGIDPAEPGRGHAGHKTRHIKTILELYPTLPFILVGDSGQEDPEIYHRAVHDHPERILAVYIRNVSRHPERILAIRKLAAEVEKAGSTLILADDTLAAARHAAESGWIEPSALPEIRAQAEQG